MSTDHTEGVTREARHLSGADYGRHITTPHGPSGTLRMVTHTLGRTSISVQCTDGIWRGVTIGAHDTVTVRGREA